MDIFLNVFFAKSEEDCENFYYRSFEFSGELVRFKHYPEDPHGPEDLDYHFDWICGDFPTLLSYMINSEYVCFIKSGMHFEEVEDLGDFICRLEREFVDDNFYTLKERFNQ